MPPRMSRRILASLSLLVTGLACGATFLGRTPSLSPRPAGPQDPARGRGDDAALLATSSDDLSLRVTPEVKAVRRSADAVVSIYLVDRRLAQPEGVLRADGQGSGVILDEQGLVITNWHVLAVALGEGNPHGVLVRLKNNRQYPARILSTSPDDDLALLQLQLPAGVALQPITLGDSSTLMVGERTIAIGNPQGHANTVTCGVLSAVDRSIAVRTPDGALRRYAGLLQTDAAINQGNSGGALLDITGKLIGINNAMAVGSENIGFAIPVDRVKRVFRDVLLSSDSLANVWLGMKVTERDGALVVSDVEASGPAARAGIREGDRVVAANGGAVVSAIEYARRILDARPGRGLSIEVERQGRRVRAEPVPLSAAGLELVRRIGLEVETVDAAADPGLVRQASQVFYAGYRRAPLLPSVVRVTHIYPDAPGERLDLQLGDVLVGFRYADWMDTRDLPFVSEQDLADKVRAFAGQAMRVYVLRDGDELVGELSVRG